MKLCKEELIIIKNAIMGKLEIHVGVVDDMSAKNVAYLPYESFDDIERQELKWAQLVLRKVINELVKINDN